MAKMKMNKPTRIKFPEHEKKYVWLRMLLNAYHANNLGVYNELKIEVKKRKEKIACHNGCHECCLKYDVPVCQIELAGISWFVSETIVDRVLREKIKSQMTDHRSNLQCPFLVDGSCSIYPVRPIACREYFVFGTPCQKNEDAIRTRPESVWGPSRNVARKTALKILPYFGFDTNSEINQAFENGFIHNNSISMHEYDWLKIVQMMEDFDKQINLK